MTTPSTDRPRGDRLPKSPPAPGAVASPGAPGETFDRSTVPGHSAARTPRAPADWRALGDEGSTQEIMGVYSRRPDADMTAADFEQATESDEEHRKALANHPSPDRAVAGYRLLAPSLPAAPLPLAAAEVTLKPSR